MDLEQQLAMNLEQVMSRYASYLDCIVTSIRAKGVSVADFRSFLLSLPAFLYGDKYKLLSGTKAQLEQADTINKIFDVLSCECASFLDYDIFQRVVDEYCIEDSEGKLNYPAHLRRYINRHKISEFIEINPQLEKYSVESTVIILKFDIELTCKLARVVQLQDAVAKILRLKSYALRILDISEGCVMVTFLISVVAARAIFAHDKQFTPKEIEEFQALKVLWLEFDGNTYDFSTQVKIPGMYSYDLQ